MRVVALLSFFDESPHHLAACIASLGKLGVDHLIAVDGRYFLYQSDLDNSGTGAHLVVLEAARGAGMGCTLHVPTGPFLGNEVEKRTLMFRLAEQVTEDGDWLMVMDADQIASGLQPRELHQILSETEEDVCEATFWEHTDPKVRELTQAPATHTFNVRILFRALPGIHCSGNHYTYVDGAGRRLWAQDTLEQAPARHLDTLRIEHRPHFRAPDRLAAKKHYYRRRDELGIERGKCDYCPAEAVRVMPANFKRRGDGNLECGHVSVCTDCAARVDAKNRKRIRYYGFDPDKIVKVTSTA